MANIKEYKFGQYASVEVETVHGKKVFRVFNLVTGLQTATRKTWAEAKGLAVMLCQHYGRTERYFND